MPTTYWGPAEWYIAFLQDQQPQIEAWESFPKQTYRNRCTILSPSGDPIMLSIPVKKVESKQYTRDVEISYQSKWQHQHWMAILSAYKKTPYFDYYQDYIRPLYEKETRFLLDYNQQTHDIVCSLIRNMVPGESFPLALTADYAAQDLERYWGNGISILDMLMKKGPETPLYL